MPSIFFDASALAKRYVEEDGTELVNLAFELVSIERMTCSTLSILEIISLLVRKRNAARIDQHEFEEALDAFYTEVVGNSAFIATAVNDPLLFASIHFISKHNINATDAVILRSALTLQQTLRARGDDVVLWTADKRLVRAAQAERLPVLDPEIASIDEVWRTGAAQGEQ